MHPAMKKGFVYEHYTVCTYDFRGIDQVFPFPIYHKETSLFPEPNNKYLSFC